MIYLKKPVAYLTNSDFDENCNLINDKIPKNIPVVIMIHGFRGTHHGLELIAKMLGGYRVIVPELPGFGKSEPFKNEHSIKNYVTWLKDIINDLHKIIPHSLDCEPNNSYLDTSGWGNLNGEMHKDSYLYIASETYTHGEYKSLTEKVFKPLANFQPFIFIAFPGALAELQKLGFKTFSPFINESYDAEQDYKTKMHMIAAEINRIVSMSKEEIHNWYWSMQDILIHNHQKLLEIYKTSPESFNLIRYLYQRVMMN